MSRKERVEFADVKVGSDRFGNSYSPISYNDGDGIFKPLFVLEKNIDTQEILLSTEIRDEKGEFLAKLYRNNFVLDGNLAFDGERAFETKQTPNTFTLTRRQDGAKIFHAEAKGDGSWKINGVLHVQIKKTEEQRAKDGDVVLKLEIEDPETIISRVITKENTTETVNMVTLANNSIFAGGIKISEYGFSM